MRAASVERNPWEERARFLKAHAIASVLRQAYSHIESPTLPLSEIAEGMNAEQRLNAAKQAGKKSVSDATWFQVVMFCKEGE